MTGERAFPESRYPLPMLSVGTKVIQDFPFPLRLEPVTIIRLRWRCKRGLRYDHEPDTVSVKVECRRTNPQADRAFRRGGSFFRCRERAAVRRRWRECTCIPNPSEV